MKKLLLGLVLLVAVATGAAAGAGQIDLISKLNPFGSSTIDRSQPAMLTSIQDLSEYHAALGNFQVIVDLEDDQDWVPSFFVGERSLFVAAGTIDAYVDLGGLADGDLTVSEDAKTVTIRLPEAELAKPNLDQEETYLASQDRGVLTRIGDAFSTDDQQELYVEAEKKISAAAEESELTRQATVNTKAMLTGMFGAMGYKVSFSE